MNLTTSLWVWLKPGKLFPDEYEVMSRHTIIGHERLKDARGIYLIDGAQIALTHHGKCDDEIIAERGRHFLPRLVDLFEQHFPRLWQIVLR